jgi:tetratricopeptide (TPR) repeat protein
MPTLSVVMIVKNEADCIEHCLETVASIADEIVVGDTGSDDETWALAEAMGARVYQVPWNEDFAAARNAVLGHASGDWLLHMDADEALDPDGAARLRALVDRDADGADAVELILANYSNDPRAWRWTPADSGDPFTRGYSGYLAVPLLRLFRNRRGFEYREPVHENITESVREEGGVIRREDILIHHYGAADPADGLEKARHYLEIARRKTGERPNDPKSWYDLAEQANACGHPQEAETACRRALELCPGDLGSATVLANLLLNRGELDEARAVLARLEAEGQRAPHIATALGAIACRQGRLDEASARLEAVATSAPHAVMARYYLARVYDLQGKAKHARRELEIARDIAHSVSEFRDLVRAHELRQEGEDCYQAGLYEQALEALVAALKFDAEDPLTHNALGVVMHGMGDVDRARESFDRALRLAPSLEEARDNLQALS